MSGRNLLPRFLFVLFLLFLALLSPVLSAESVATFPSGQLTLHGVLFRPEGPGPFPAVLYNHGSAAGMLSKEAFDALGPVFATRGWVFFGPYRRGQGLSKAAGPYIGDEISAAERNAGHQAAVETMIRLLETDHLNDQLAALGWLKTQSFVDPHRIAVAGNSFGGIEAVLGAERGRYCGAIDAAGGARVGVRPATAEGHDDARCPRCALADLLFSGAKRLRSCPEPRTFGGHEGRQQTVPDEIYPAYGKTPADGHAFAYFGSSVWADDVFRFLQSNCGN